MSKRAKSLESLRDTIQAVIAKGKALEGKTYIDDADQNLGLRIQNGRIYVITSDFSIAARDIIERTLSVFGNSIMNEQDVEEVIWEVIYRDVHPYDTYKLFKEILSGYVSECTRVIIPNFQIRFESGLEEICVGPVRAVLGSKLVNDFSSYREDGWTFSVNIDDVRSSGNKNIYSFDVVCWDVEVKTSHQAVHQQAVWEINVALGLLRIILLPRNEYGMFPVYGDEEVAVGVRLNTKRVVLYENRNRIKTAGAGVPPHYKISCENAKTLESEINRKKINQVFGAEKGSVAERVKRGLGWLTRARQMTDQAERHLYFSTAIETLLTSEDKDAKVTENIGRNGSVILTNNNRDRCANYRILVESYGVRSRIVHGGSRDVSKREGRLIQEIAELLYQKVIFLTDLSESYESFQQSLRTASFGTAWANTLTSVEGITKD